MTETDHKSKKKKPDGHYFQSRPNTKLPDARRARYAHGSKSKPQTSFKPAPARKHTRHNGRRPNAFQRFLRAVAGVVGTRGLLIGLAVIVLGLSSAAVWFFAFRKNANKVFIGEQSVGIVAMNKAVTEQSMFDLAVAKLETELGTRVNILEPLTFKPVHAGKAKLSKPEFIISGIYKTWPYEVEASIINVDGIDVAPLKTHQEAEEVLNRFASAFVSEGAVIVDKQFEGTQVVKKFVKPEALVSTETAFASVNKYTEKSVPYTVRSGDVVSAIAARAGMTTEEFYAVNPDVSADNLQIGQIVNIVMQAPVISVTTVESTTASEVAPMPRETRENPSQYKTYSKVIQQGKDGRKEVTYHITKVNGVETGREVVSETILEEPVPEVTEVGTSETVPIRS